MPAGDPDHRRFSFGEFVIDCDRGTLSHAGSDVRLRPKSFDVLCHLAEHRGRLVTKSELMEAVWGRTVVTEGSMTQCVIDIRRALGPQARRMLRTVPRRGFIFDPPPPSTTLASDATFEGPDTRQVRAAAVTTRASERRPWVPALAISALLAISIGGWTLRQHWAIQSSAASRPVAAHPANSIAVLRFLDLSPEGDQGYLADGLADEILHALSRSAGLRVTARGSSFQFDPGHASTADIARRLNVAYVLEGSVRRAKEQLRVTVQLVDTSTHAQVWSRSYDRQFEELLSVQREIAADIARQFRVTLGFGHLAANGGNARSQELFMLGHYLFHRRAPGDLASAERYLAQAVELDPTHARALTALAGVYNVRGWEELGNPRYRLEDQRRALERALEIDPGLAEAHARLARYHWAAGNHEAARASLDRAFALAPDDPLVLGFRANAAIATGKLEEAITLGRRAVERDPLSAVYRGNLGRTLVGAGRFEDGLVEFRRADELSPQTGFAFDISRTLLLLGRPEDARQESLAIEDRLDRDQLTALLGEPPEADSALQRLRAADSAWAELLLAEISAFRQDEDGAFRHLEAALTRIMSGPTAGDGTGVIDILQSPFLRPLHDDPRWKQLNEAQDNG